MYTKRAWLVCKRLPRDSFELLVSEDGRCIAQPHWSYCKDMFGFHLFFIWLGGRKKGRRKVKSWCYLYMKRSLEWNFSSFGFEKKAISDHESGTVWNDRMIALTGFGSSSLAQDFGSESGALHTRSKYWAIEFDREDSTWSLGSIINTSPTVKHICGPLMLPYLVFCQPVKPWVIFNLNTASSNKIKRQVERPQSWYMDACNWFLVSPTDYMKTHSKMVLLSGSVTRDEFALIPSVWNDKKTWFDLILGSPNCARSCRTIKSHSKGFSQTISVIYQ